MSEHRRNHELGLVLVGCEAGERPEGVAPHVHELDDLLTLVVVAEDQEPLAEAERAAANTRDQVLVGCRGCSRRGAAAAGGTSLTP